VQAISQMGGVLIWTLPPNARSRKTPGRPSLGPTQGARAATIANVGSRAAGTMALALPHRQGPVATFAHPASPRRARPLVAARPGEETGTARLCESSEEVGRHSNAGSM